MPIRWVLTRDPSDKRPPKAIFSTDLLQTAAQIIRDFMKRWSLEVTFEEGRAHLGIETQRQWSDLAIERTTPLLFGLYSLVALFGQAVHPDGQIPVAQTGWYRKQVATFRDVLALVRQHLWCMVFVVRLFRTKREMAKSVITLLSGVITLTWCREIRREPTLSALSFSLSRKSPDTFSLTSSTASHLLRKSLVQH